jgi:hypothetical protein
LVGNRPVKVHTKLLHPCVLAGTLLIGHLSE